MDTRRAVSLEGDLRALNTVVLLGVMKRMHLAALPEIPSSYSRRAVIIICRQDCFAVSRYEKGVYVIIYSMCGS